MSVSDDKLRIPIEVKTEDIKEIQQLIQDITEAESDLRQVLPKKGRGTADVTSRSAFTRSEPFDERGGIFGTQKTGDILPSNMRDKSSKQAIQKDREWDKLQQKVDSMEQISNNTINAVSQIAGLVGMSSIVSPLLTQFGSFTKPNFVATAKSGLAAGKNALGSGTGAAGITGRLGGLGKMLGAFGGVSFAVSIALEVSQLIIEALQMPGGFLDRRFKRIIKDEIASSTERAEKAQIAQGLRLIRISAYGGFRGETISMNGLATSRGQPIFDSNMEARSKGLL